MAINTKEEYVKALSALLSDIPFDEHQEALRYIEEYFDEAGEENTEKVIEELGTPEKQASILRADIMIKNKKEGLRTKHGIWTIVLGVLSLPISVPLLLAFGVLVFTLVLVLVVLGISFVIVAGALLLTSTLSLISALTVFPVNFASGLLALGLGLAFSGISILLLQLSVIAFKAIYRFVQSTVERIYKKNRKKGNSYETH